jgi:transcription initiation factor TFIIA small subunit
MSSPQVQLEYELYRHTQLGKALTDTLSVLLKDKSISPPLAADVLQQFDKTVNQLFWSDRIKTITDFTGHLHSYQNDVGMWTFFLENAQFKLKNGDKIVLPDRVKIVGSSADIYLPVDDRDTWKAKPKRELKKRAKREKL